MTQMSAQREHDYFAETVICANCCIVAKCFTGNSLFHLLPYVVINLLNPGVAAGGRRADNME